ncbi:MAG: argininosuccinate synthase domain-containing protein [Bacteroidota bacterium]
MSKPILVLAYSGGLDTSYCIKYLTTEKDYQVHAISVNTGGFSEKDIQKMEAQAYQLGATYFECIEAEKTYYEQCIRYLIYGNVLRNNTYPLSVSAERLFQAIAIVQYANTIGAKAVAHGSTGAGNDQVRFDLVFNTLGPHLDIVTPIRDLQLSRKAEIDYLQQHGFDWPWEKGKYSINQGLWGTSVGGAETLTSHLPLPETAYPSPLQKETPSTVQLHFEKGELTGIDQTYFDHPVEAIHHLAQLAQPYAIGRDIHVGDTIIGIKGRVGFEAAAPLIILKAHHLLEKHVLTKWQQYWKEQLANWYGMLLHEGQFLDPVMRNIEGFLSDCQAHVSGTVHIQLHPYRFKLQGIESEYDLLQHGFGQYGEANKAWTGEDVKGFTKILGNAPMIYHHKKTADTWQL